MDPHPGQPISREMEQNRTPGVRSRKGLSGLQKRAPVVVGQPDLRSVIPGMDAVQGQPRPDRSMESTTGLTWAGIALPLRCREFARGDYPRDTRGAVLMAGNGVEPARDALSLLVSGSNSSGNGLLKAGAEPLDGRASETAGGANLHSVHLPTRIMPSAGRCSLEMSTAPARRSPACWKCPLRRPLGSVQLA